jgi:hypothetical protein
LQAAATRDKHYADAASRLSNCKAPKALQVSNERYRI